MDEKTIISHMAILKEIISEFEVGLGFALMCQDKESQVSIRKRMSQMEILIADLTVMKAEA